MDRIHIVDLLCRAVVGVTAEERRERQDLLVNLTLDTDFAEAARTDDFGRAVDYRALKKRILALVEGSRFHLIETLAERVAALCLEDPRVRTVRVRVDKPGALRFARSVAVEVERRRER